MAIHGQSQGVIKGAPVNGRDPKWLGVLHYELGPAVQAHPQGGRPHTGRTVVVTREVDAASPRLLQACNTKESIISATVEQYDVSSNGQSRLKSRLTLTKGSIAAIQASGALVEGRSIRVETLRLTGETLRNEQF
jgi:type VI secretion system Hcp family effector